MAVLSAALILHLAAAVTLAAQSDCKNSIQCPCGNTGKNITTCIGTKNDEIELCGRWSRCKICRDWLNTCLECEDGFEGLLCSIKRSGNTLQSRQKRQFYYPFYGRISQGPRSRLQNTSSRPTIRKSVIQSKATCTDPGFVSNGFRRLTDGSHSNASRPFQGGEFVVYGCRSNDLALQGSPLLICKNDGTWSSPLPKCIRPVAGNPRVILKYCRDLGVDPNGIRRPESPPSNERGFPQGTRVQYFCVEGFDSVGDPEIFCLSSGKWSASRPKCERQQYMESAGFGTGPSGAPVLSYCPNPGPIANGQVVYHPSITSRGRRGSQLDEVDAQYPEGSVLQYSCNGGYTLKGGAFLSCESPGFWSDDRPACRRDAGRLR